MRAMSRARSTSAAMRAVASMCSHGVVGAFVGIGIGGGSVSSRKTRRNCMAAPLMRCRLRRPAQESVDDPAQVEQIIEPAKSVGSWAGDRRLRIPISPSGRNERTGAVRQDNENKAHAALSDAVNYRKRLTLKRVSLTRNDH